MLSTISQPFILHDSTTFRWLFPYNLVFHEFCYCKGETFNSTCTYFMFESSYQPNAHPTTRYSHLVYHIAVTNAISHISAKNTQPIYSTVSSPRQHDIIITQIRNITSYRKSWSLDRHVTDNSS